MPDDDGLPWRHGAKVGAIAWLAGFLVICLLLAIGFGIGAVVSAPDVFLAQSIFFFLGTHGWPLLVVTTVPISVAPILFLPVPAMLLFAAGYRVATVAGVRWNRAAYRTGATVIAGYAPMTLLSLLVIAALVGSFSSISVYVLIVGFTGLLLPLIAAGFGGVIAAR